MNIKHVLFYVIISISLSQVYSQVHLFEQGRSGLMIPMLNIDVSPDIQSWQVGASYTVEGRLSFSGFFGMPLSDTLFQNDSNKTDFPLPSDEKSNFWHVNMTGELIEPDKVFPLSVSLQIGYTMLKYSHSRSAKFAGTNNSVDIVARSFKSHYLYSGLIFGFRFFTGPHSLLVPTLNYNFGYIMRGRLTAKSLKEYNDDFGHQGKIGLLYNQMFTEYIGIMVEPKVAVSYNHNEDEPTIFAQLKAGLVLQFN